MPVAIYIPDDVSPSPGSVSVPELHAKLAQCSTRSVLFHQENVTGYIVHTGRLPPASVFLTSTFESRNSSGFLDAAETPVVQAEGHTTTVDKIVGQETVGDDTVTIWQFQVCVALPTYETAGTTRFVGSLQNPHLPKTGELSSKTGELSFGIDSDSKLEESKIGDATGSAERKQDKTKPETEPETRSAKSKSKVGIDRKDEKTAKNGPHLEQKSDKAGHLEQSKTQVSENHKNERTKEFIRLDPESSAVLNLPTFTPLLLRLRSTKPGGRSDVLLTTLRVEAAEQIVRFAARFTNREYHYNILSLETRFDTGKIAQLGAVPFPHKCSLKDVLNITYKLVSNDFLECSLDGSARQSAISRPIYIKLQVQVEKHDLATNSVVPVTNVISTEWTPLLEFGTAPLTNVLRTNATNTPSLMRHRSPLRTKTTPKPASKKAVAINSVVSSYALDASPSPQLGPSSNLGSVNLGSVNLGGSTYGSSLSTQNPGAFAHQNSSGGLAPPKLTSAMSSPALTQKSKSALRNLSTRSQPALVGTASNVTVNLGSHPNSTLSGLQMTITGTLSLELGKPVTWKVQAINKTSRSLKLSLIVGQRRRRAEGPYASSLALPASHSQSSFSELSAKDARENNGTQIYNRLQLCHQYNAMKMQKMGVVVLTNDVGFGILEPNQVYESEVRLVGITKGIFDLKGWRIYDSNSGEAIDFGRLLEIFVM